MGNNYELWHWGVKGMRWGVRRYQNKDGSLTPQGKKRYGENSDSNPEETVEEQRARVLKSTDAKELYKNRSILTTAEINERLNRIDAEKRLGNVAASTRKSGMEKVDRILKYGRKINELYEFANTPVMKAIRKKITGEPETKPFDWEIIWKNRNKLSSDDLSKAAKRAVNEKLIRNYIDEIKKAKDRDG